MLERNVFVIVPVHNEAPVLGSTLEALLTRVSSVVVVDDGSKDGSGEIARRYPVHYVRHPVNLGQGAALETGTVYALRQGAEVLVHFDADGQHPADQIPTFVRPILGGECDVVLGSRFLLREDISLIPLRKRLVLAAGRLVNALLTRVWLTDTHNGFRALSRSAAERIRLRENGFAHASEFLDRMRAAGIRYREMPSTIRYTPYSVQKGQSILNGINIIWDLMVGKVMK